MWGDSSYGVGSVSYTHGQWRPSGLFKYLHSTLATTLALLFVMGMLHQIEAQEEPYSDLNLSHNNNNRLLSMDRDESNVNDDGNDGTRYETTTGELRYVARAEDEEPLSNSYLPNHDDDSFRNRKSGTQDDGGEAAFMSALENEEDPRDRRTSQPTKFMTVSFLQLLEMLKMKKGFNALNRLIPYLHSTPPLTKSLGLQLRSMSVEDYVEPVVQTRRSHIRMFRPRLRWG